MNAKLKRLVICIISVAVLVVIDQLTKMWAVKALMDKPAIPLIKNVLELHYLNNGNTGAAFGLFKGQRVLFLIIASVMCVLLLYIIYNLPKDPRFKYLTILMTFIIAGGIGNMIDRFRLKYVIDFIYIKIINFPIFNVADMYVSVCTTLLLIMMIFYYKEEDFSMIENIIRKLFRLKPRDIAPK